MASERPKERRGRKLMRAVKLPRISGKATAAVLIGCFLLTGLLIPLVLRKDLWIDAEIVVASWWLIWVVALTAILYRGHRVTDDHTMGQPQSWNLKEHLSGWFGGTDWVPIGGVDSEACLVGCLIIAALPLLVLLIWFMIEVAIPGILFVAYFLVRGQLANVANDRHRCEGSVIHSFLWGTLWATIYTVPLAGLVWFVHFVSTRASV